ncbi:MAG: trypsin-like peptidase domain-containing protein [Akkermansiaceae bacterium]|nr:trypsin-like peptidase domain-containing protein [Armatimonadota bacterium]
MNNQTVSALQRIGGGAAVAAVAVVAGYSLRDAGAQSPKPASAPVVRTPAVQSAAEMQSAFAQVARVAEPAVVTITTAKRASALSSNDGSRRFRIPNPNGGNGSENDSFEEFFRRFREFGVEPNGYKGDTAAGGGDGFRFAQDAPPQRRGNGAFVDTGVGSGVIYDKSGLILTNAHVVEGADRVTVKLLDGREFKDAKVLGVDTRTDVAVVKIPTTNAPAVTLGDSGKVTVGDWAIAVGNPFGLSNTLTVGVISASAREVNFNDSGSLNDYLQTDASINPGNSGGPLLDIYGRVIGINNAIYTRSGGNVGIGFAIPINVAKRVADALVKDGKVRRAIIGVGMRNVSEDTAAFGLPAGTKGVIVQQVVPNSPAARAGVQIGDVITAWNGETTTRDTELQRKVTASPIGKPGTLTVQRNGKTVTLSVTPDELTPTQTTPRPTTTEPEQVAPTNEMLGVALAPLDDKTRATFNIPATVRSGVVVARVQSGGVAERAGIAVGDVIQRVGQTVVNVPADVDRAKDAILKGQTADAKSVAMYVVKRNGEGGVEGGFIVLQIGE